MPTFLLSKRSLLAATVAGAALLAAGCGSSSDSTSSSDASPTTEWADGLCSAINTWTASITVDRRHDQERQYLQGLADDRCRRREERDGDADVRSRRSRQARYRSGPGGEGLGRQALHRSPGRGDDDRGRARRRLGHRGLHRRRPRDLTALGTMGTDVTSTVTTLQGLDAKGELQSAFDDASSCADLTGS